MSPDGSFYASEMANPTDQGFFCFRKWIDEHLLAQHSACVRERERELRWWRHQDLRAGSAQCLFLCWGSVLVSSSCCNKNTIAWMAETTNVISHRLTGLNNKYISHSSAEVLGSPRSQCQHGPVLVRTVFLISSRGRGETVRERKRERGREENAV